VALAPAQVHAQEHVRPIRGLGPTRPGADREDCVLRVVLAGEEQQGAFPLELGPERVGLAADLGLGLRVGGVGQEVEQLFEVRGPLLQLAPQGDLIAQALGFAGDLLRRARVVPEPGLTGAGVELGDPRLLGG
jgi:hypothetical protein